MAILAKHYYEVVVLLKKDPIVQEMAKECESTVLNNYREFYHHDGTPTSWWMNTTNKEYGNRKGEIQDRHLGAIGEAIRQLIEE